MGDGREGKGKGQQREQLFLVGEPCRHPDRTSFQSEVGKELLSAGSGG